MSESDSTTSSNKLALVAQIISAIVHPMILPTVGVWFIVSKYFIPNEIKMLTLAIVAIGTFILPVSCIPVFKIAGIIDSIKMHNKRERNWPLVISIFFATIVTYIVFYINPFLFFVKIYMLSTLVLTIIALMINLYWKISLHAIGIGGFTAMILIMGIGTKTETIVALPLAFLASGAICSARLLLKAHTPLQVAAGYALGMLVTTFITLLFF